ncbi:class II aldolase/adducin N-terminal [Jimgerdemannia flammicorona]|uniref:Class II aldolase/adducin N-terminal n=1 Tax=Jimgerdemannia flammicorona TaxID=994334 RepID=A0A433A1T2_9FUNG|nr:class II aldolase/adducin N-terminal [Jimgerdemannia flammicorona]
MYGKAFSSLGRLLLPITQDACAFYESHALFDDYAGVVYSTDEGARIAKALGPTNKAVILRNHGLLTVGTTVASAIWWFVSMERCAQAQLIAEQAAINGHKDLITIDHDMARAAHDIIGVEQTGQFSFQPMYQMIVRDQPDCLE